MNIFITGGSGFIGTYLVSDLIDKGHHVVIYDKVMSETFPKHCIIGDVRDPKHLTESLEGMDAVVHLAAEHRDDVRPISLYQDVNVKGTANLITACAQQGINRLVFTSSVAIYGLNAGVPDETRPAKPFNEYGKSKYQAEQVLKSWAEENAQCSLTIVRPTVIFGENNRGNVYNLLRQIVSKHFVMVGSGNNQKSMGYVRNLSRFLESTLMFGTGIHIYNYSDMPDLTMNALVSLVNETLGRSGLMASLKMPYLIGLSAGYIFDLLSKISGRTYPISSIRVRKFCADTRINAERAFNGGFVPPFSLREGLRKTILHEFPI